MQGNDMLTKSASTIVLAILTLAAPAAALAQTRDYNPIRRTSATEELPAATPRGPQTENWTSPAISGPPGQWRSIRQPGPVQLPMPRQVPPPTSAPVPVAPMQGSGAPEEISADAISGEWQDESPWQDGPSCQGSDCEGCDECCGDDCGGCGMGRGFGLCGGACGRSCGHLGHMGHLGHILPRSWQLFGGVHGFK